jgi:hypothetical protein
MREIEVQLKHWKLAGAMSELRKWLDHNADRQTLPRKRRPRSRF